MKETLNKFLAENGDSPKAHRIYGALSVSKKSERYGVIPNQSA